MSPRDIARLVRPRQWTKNLAVFAALIFAGSLFHTESLMRASLAFVALCLVSGGLYAANDSLDAELDRQHPVKRTRPVASGRLSIAQGWIVAVSFTGLGLALSAVLGPPFLISVGIYLTLQVTYVLWMKHVVIIDMLVIAAGFVIRAIAGAEVIRVSVSPWLVICTGLLALFLAAAKRRHELLLLGDDSADHRPVLEEYSAELLDSFMVTLSAATITSYALYTFFEPSGPKNAMMFTIPFVIYGVLRYQYLVLSKDAGGRPEDVLLGDRATMLTVALWAATAILIIYAL